MWRRQRNGRKRRISDIREIAEHVDNNIQYENEENDVSKTKGAYISESIEKQYRSVSMMVVISIEKSEEHEWRKSAEA